MVSLRLQVILTLGLLGLFVPVRADAQRIQDGILSEHVRVRIPMERESVARDSIAELERCWKFMHAATGSLPRRTVVVIMWESDRTSVDYDEGIITIGMDQPGVASDPSPFLVHAAAREMARLGLLRVSRGGAAAEQNQFLLQGMAEILTREYERSSRGLSGAWVVAQLLDRMKLLGLAQEARWSAFAGGRNTLRAAAPGITLLETCRELRGRDSLLKIFESLKSQSLPEALYTVFNSTAAAVEATWLKKVRQFDLSEVTSAGDSDGGPSLDRVVYPATVRAGSTLAMRLYSRDRINPLAADALFVRDAESGAIVQPRNASEGADRFLLLELPIESGRKPGQYQVFVTAVDDAGNVRQWEKTYSVQ
jgi:hypothetical protein